jgi:protein-tyrosine kinase
MEHIRKAVERAKDEGVSGHLTAQSPHMEFASNFGMGSPSPPPAALRDVSLDNAYLETRRIVAHDIRDLRSRAFDMLRTQILQSMDAKSWQFLGITSATEGCGKSVVACNLALSIARQPERSVLLIDLDLQKPQVGNYLGLSCEHGILSVLSGRTSLGNALVQARIRNGQVLVLPCESHAANSSAWIASRPMSALLQEIKRDFQNWTVIFDLPPILSSDDVISMLPRLDCVAFVVGAGTTTVEEIKECNRHLELAEIVRVVLNKSEDTAAHYYSYSRPSTAQRRDQSVAKDSNKPPASKRVSRFFARSSKN